MNRALESYNRQMQLFSMKYYKRTVIRLGALGAMVAGVAWLASFIIVIVDSTTEGLIPIFGFPYSDLGRTMYVIVLTSVPWGLMGLAARQETHYGLLGRVGSLAAFSGDTLTLIGLGLILLFRGDFLGQEPAVTLGLSSMVVGLTLLGTGFLLLGIATLRARVLPRSCGIALIIAFVAVLVPVISPAGLGSYAVTIVLGFVWLALGYVLWVS